MSCLGIRTNLNDHGRNDETAEALYGQIKDCKHKATKEAITLNLEHHFGRQN